MTRLSAGGILQRLSDIDDVFGQGNLMDVLEDLESRSKCGDEWARCCECCYPFPISFSMPSVTFPSSFSGPSPLVTALSIPLSLGLPSLASPPLLSSHLCCAPPGSLAAASAFPQLCLQRVLHSLSPVQLPLRRKVIEAPLCFCLPGCSETLSAIRKGSPWSAHVTFEMVRPPVPSRSFRSSTHLS